MLLLTRTVCLIRLAYVKAAPSSTQSVGRTLLVTPRPNITTSSRPCIRSQSFWFHSNSKATSSRVDIGMSAGDVGRQDDGESSGSVRPRPRVPVSSITAFGQGLGQAELQSLSEELKAAGEGENLLSPFVNKVYDASNAALFYAHNGRLDFAQERLQAGAELVLAELKRVDETSSRQYGVRQDRVSNCLENFVKAKAFVHFLRTGRLLRRADAGKEIEDADYLGAIMRLTSELSSYAITQASVLDRDSIRACASLFHALFGELVEFDFRNGPLRKKFDGVKYDVRKVDDILYELSLVESGTSATVGGVDGDGGGGGIGGSKKREREDDHRGDGGVDDEEADVLDRGEFEVMRATMTEFDEKREAVIKRTRDVQKWSKMAIYSLHRGDVKKAEKQVSDCRKAAAELLPIVTETPRLRMGAFSSCMEEFAEARLYQLWLKEKRLASRADVGLVNTEEYLGGLLDLTGELNRYAVARATERDTAGVKECLETVLVIHEFVTLNNLPGKLPKKKGELFNSFRKLKNMTYELALMKAGKGKVAGVSGVDDGPPPQGEDS